MNQQDLVSEIINFFIQFSQEVKSKNRHKLLDINIVSEDVLIPILNIIFNNNLKNLNSEKSNFPGIDLATNETILIGDKIAFQITSDNSIGKIKETLEKCIKNDLYKNYKEIYIYNLVEKQKTYQKKSVEEIKKLLPNDFSFDLNKNVIDRTDLESKIQQLTPISKIETIHKLLEDQFKYQKKSLLSLDIWQSDGKIGYGFSNLIEGINQTTFHSLVQANLPSEAKEILLTLLTKYNVEFSKNYEKENHEKFKNLGFNTYLKAGFEQAISSFVSIKENIKNKIEEATIIDSLKNTLGALNMSLDESSYPLVDKPIDHPAIKIVKEITIEIFRTLAVDVNDIDLYLKNFNQNISNTVADTFGVEAYTKHLRETEGKWIRENEKDFLLYMKNLAKLGFVEGENLEYQETLGNWEDIRNYNMFNEDSYVKRNRAINRDTEFSDDINNLQPIEKLIEDYFNSYKNDSEGYLNNILFLVADFGKGKTSFFHQLASKLSQQYLKTHEGLFPVYINLNQYETYTNSSRLGIIANYLAKAFRIDISDSYFKKKDYLFLVDSLDESGELTESHIDNVIKEIQAIQNLDNINQRKNRIVIASRPIANGLKELISKYRPYLIKAADDETTENYISVHGFKKEQFNRYITQAIINYLKTSNKNSKQYTGISKEIVEKIEQKKEFDIHNRLKEDILKESELQRPIFAYMIYKLIISNTNFIEFGKVGVYISFLNQLSKEAKHKDDINHKISIKDEFVYRNILHASALLWQYKRQTGEQTTLTKADICRTIEEKEIDRDDRKVLAEFKDIDSIHFLSHSYLGEKDNTLHFQHQSFAEILLAEYYLKVFIKYAIEENTDVEEARIKLSIGIPTDQTIDFLKGLLTLLKECSLGDPKDKTIYSKRALIVPVLASMAIQTHNKKLYSTRLNATWFEIYQEQIFSKNKITEEIIKNFPITSSILEKIELLCRKIINSSRIYLLDEARNHSVIYKNELIEINPIVNTFSEIDKWFALVAGNIIKTDIPNRIFFNSKIHYDKLFEMIKNWNYHNGNIPLWSVNCFMGIDMQENMQVKNYDLLNLMNINFSYSYFKSVYFENCYFRFVDFSDSAFELVKIESSDISYAKFNNIKIIETEEEEIEMIFDTHLEGNLSLVFCHIDQGVFFPARLNRVLKGTTYGLVNYGDDKSVIKVYDNTIDIEKNIFPLIGLFKYILKKGKTVEFILNSFIIKAPVKIKTEFNEKFRDLLIEEQQNL